MFKSLNKADQAKIIQTLAPEYSGKGITPELPPSRWNKGMVVRVITASDSPDAFLSLTLKTVKITQCISDYFWGTCLKDGTDAKYSPQTDYIMALPTHPPTKDSYGLLHELLISLLAEGDEYPNEFHFEPRHVGGPYLFKPLNITDLRKGEVIGLVGRALDYPQVYTTGLGRRWSEIADHGELWASRSSPMVKLSRLGRITQTGQARQSRLRSRGSISQSHSRWTARWLSFKPWIRSRPSQQTGSLL